MKRLAYLFIVQFTLLVAIPAESRMVEGSKEATGRIVLDNKSSTGSLKKAESSLQEKWRKFKSDVSYKFKAWLNRDKTNEKQEEIEKAMAEKAEKEKKQKALEEQRKKERKVAKDEILQNYPSFVTEDKGTSLKELKEVNEEMQAQPSVVVSEMGRKADPKLPKTKSGVAYFKLKEKKTYKTKKGKKKVKMVSVKNLPKLDIGQERKVKAGDWSIPELRTFIANFGEPKKLKSPSLQTEKSFAKVLGKKVKKASGQKEIKITTLKSLGIEREKLLKVRPQLAQLKEITEKAVSDLSFEELKLLNALIHYEKGNKCHIAAGLYHELSKSKNSEMQTIANLHVGICAHKMGLFTESVRRLLDVLRSNQDEFKPEAMAALLKDVPFEYEIDIGLVIQKDDLIKFVSKEQLDSYHYTIAKAKIRLKQFSEASVYAEKVSANAKQYIKAQYVLAVAEYMLGKVSVSLQRQQKLKQIMDNSNQYDEKVYSLVAINLARVNFQKNRYNDAIQGYLKIDKKHPYWVQGLQEQGWAQLLTQDEAGAIGNMHSLQSPYFQAVYKPESYVIRTIGYINLCHYGDAYKTLTTLEKRYSPWYKSMQAFLKTNRKPASYYGTVSEYLKSNSTRNVNKLPFQVIREMARHRDYLNVQDAINKLVDEKDQFNFIAGIINKDRRNVRWKKNKSRARQKAIEKRMRLAKTDKKILKELNELKKKRLFEIDLQKFYSFQLETFEKSKNGLRKFQKEGRQYVQNRKSKLKRLAGELLRDRLVSMTNKLAEVLKNNEFLRYEVFAGSGENLRYLAGGGATGKNRVPASAVPKSKDLKWTFDGEFWADEVGHYRSGLKSNCSNASVKR